MVRLSIVIPTYNRPGFLDGAITSAIKQTYSDLEVIVVDDGSDDDYASHTVDQFSDTVNCVIHEENKGLSAARNTGIEHADGDYIAFLDDDDRWHEDKSKRQIEALESVPDAGLSTCRLAAIDLHGELLRCDGGVVSGDIADRILTRNVIGSPSRVLVHRRALPSDRPFDEELPTKQDWDLYMRLCQEWAVVGVDEVLCYRTRHGGMSSDPADAKTDNMRVIEKHQEEIKRRDLWLDTMAEYYQKVGVTYLLDEQHKPARRALWHAIRRNPVPETVGLMCLTFTTHGAFRRVLSLKRWVERLKRDCGTATDIDNVPLAQ